MILPCIFFLFSDDPWSGPRPPDLMLKGRALWCSGKDDGDTTIDEFSCSAKWGGGIFPEHRIEEMVENERTWIWWRFEWRGRQRRLTGVCEAIVKVRQEPATGRLLM